MPTFDELIATPPARVAILLPDMIGTTVCAMPAVQAVRRALPAARVCLLGFTGVSEFLRDEPAAADLRLLELAQLPQQLARALKDPDQPVELALDFLSTPDSEAQLARLGITHRVGWPNDGPEPGHTVAVPFPGERHQQATEDYLDFVRALGLPAKAAPPRLTAGPATRQAARRWLEQQGAGPAPLLALGVGGGNDRKRWPLARYIELGRHLERRDHGQAVFFCGPQEAHLARQLRAQWPAALLADSLPLDLVKGLLAEARLAVCNDHAVMHLAAALGVATVGLFLASDPEQWFPYAAPSSHVVGPPLDCRPCYSEQCEHWECNHPALYEQVLQRVDAIL